MCAWLENWGSFGVFKPKVDLTVIVVTALLIA